MVKSAAIAVFSAHFALVFHVLGGGVVPGVEGTLLVMALAMVAGLGLCGRGQSLLRTSLAATASQVLFHVLFTATAAPVTVQAHGHHSQHVVFDAAAASAVHPPMWVGHAAAAVLTVGFVRGFDTLSAAVASVAGALILPFLLFFRAFVLPAPRPAVRRRAEPVLVRAQTVLSVSPLRGPPVGMVLPLRRLPA